MATAVLGSPAHSSLWSAIKNEKHSASASGWNDNGGWGSGSNAWGSGTGRPGEWGSGEGADEGGWGASGGGWGGGGGWASTSTSTSGAWTSGESSGSGGAMAKQATLTDLWSERQDSSSSSSSVPRRDAEDEGSSSSANPQLHAEVDQTLENDTYTGWGTGAGTNGSIWATTTTTTTSDNGTGKANENTSVADVPSAPLFSPVLYSQSLNPDPTPNPTGADATAVRPPLFSPVLYPTPPDLPVAAAPATSSSAQTDTHLTPSTSHPRAEAFAQSSSESFITLPNGSAEYRLYPTSYDLCAMWDAGYAGHYSAMDLSADAVPSSAVAESMDRHLERYYWDVRYQSEIPTPSPYIQELHHLPEKHRHLFLDRLAHIDYMFSRVERKIYPGSSSSRSSSSDFQSSPSSKGFESQQDKDAKQTVYKALRVLYRVWHDGAEYPSVVDWEGDHCMPYRVGPMVG